MNENDFERGRMAWHEKLRGYDDGFEDEEIDDLSTDELLEIELCASCSGSGQNLFSPDGTCLDCEGRGAYHDDE